MATDEHPTSLKTSRLKTSDNEEVILHKLSLAEDFIISSNSAEFSSPDKSQLSSASTVLTPGEEMFYTPRNLSRSNDQTNNGGSILRSAVAISRSIPPNPSTGIPSIKNTLERASNPAGIASSDAGAEPASSGPESNAPTEKDAAVVPLPSASTTALTRKLEKAKTVIGKLKEENKALNEKLQSVTESVQQKQSSNEEQLQRQLQKQLSKMSDLITENESLNLQNISLCQQLVNCFNNTTITATCSFHMLPLLL